MELPTWIRPMAWGIVLGVTGTVIVGFSWGGWTLAHTTKRLVAEGRESAVVAVLTPFCVTRYLQQPDAATQLAVLRADTSPYTQRDVIEKAGFATMPGNPAPTVGVAAGCVDALRSASVAAPEAKTTTK